jgi:hypothetical protein
MAMIDPEQERQGLVREYSRMMDGELEKIAQSFGQLTNAAQRALIDEMSRRGIQVEPAGRDGGAFRQIPDSEQHGISVRSEGQTVVRRFFSLAEALIAQSKLRSDGIDSFIAEENVLGTNPYLAHVLGGARLFVDTADSAAAKDILDEPVPAEFDVEGVGKYVQPRCPQCFSLEISFRATNDASLALGLPIAIQEQAWICRACGCRWQESDDA